MIGRQISVGCGPQVRPNRGRTVISGPARSLPPGDAAHASEGNAGVQSGEGDGECLLLAAEA